MKARGLALLAGLGGTLLLGPDALADITSITWEEQDNPYGLLSLAIYATFDNPNDRLVAVAGSPLAPMHIEVIGGTFYQHVLGTDLAPNPTAIASFPSLAYDSYVTIGKSTSIDDQTMLTPGWPGFGASVLPSHPADQINIAWFAIPDEPQTLAGGDLRVLLGVFSTADGIGFEGSLLVQASVDGDPMVQTMFSFDTTPAPGTWAALGVAALARRRRRRYAPPSSTARIGPR